MSARAFIAFALACVALAWGGGCKNDDKIGQQKADAALERMLPLVARDTKQVRDGLPTGAVELGKLLPRDPGADLEGLRRALQKARSSVRDLAYAKSTFFIFVDTAGVVQRSEGEPDLAAGKSLLQAVPETKKLADPAADLVELYGYMEGLRGVNKGSDLQWMVGHPVMVDDKLVGSFVTGFSLRLYAKFLEDDLRFQLSQEQEKTTKAIPLMYVFIVRGDGAYGAPITPDVNADALVKLELPAKVASGPYAGALDVEGRHFVVAARPCPELGDGVGLAIMLSEF